MLRMCRYSAFIPLYPLGILGGEMPLIWNGLPYIKQRSLHSLEMPNSFNFAFSYHAFAQVRLVDHVFSSRRDVLLAQIIESAISAEQLGLAA